METRCTQLYFTDFIRLHAEVADIRYVSLSNRDGNDSGIARTVGILPLSYIGKTATKCNGSVFFAMMLQVRQITSTGYLTSSSKKSTASNITLL